MNTSFVFKAAGIVLYARKGNTKYGLVAIQRRRKNSLYNFVGGKALRGETPEDCAAREFKEEVLGSENFVKFVDLKKEYEDNRSGYVLFSKEVSFKTLEQLLKCKVKEISSLHIIPLKFNEKTKKQWHRWCFTIGQNAIKCF